MLHLEFIIMIKVANGRKICHQGKSKAVYNFSTFWVGCQQKKQKSIEKAAYLQINIKEFTQCLIVNIV